MSSIALPAARCDAIVADQQDETHDPCSEAEVSEYLASALSKLPVA
jgi:hypothetical protein